MKTKAAVGLFILIGAVIIWFQFQKQKSLREEIETLRQQIAQFQTDNENLSNRLVAADAAKSLPDKEHDELLKLRGEVGVLRNQMAKLKTQHDKNPQPQSQSFAEQNQMVQVSQKDYYRLHQLDMNIAMKQFALAMRMYAADNNDQYPANVNQITNYLSGTNFQGNIGLDEFEIINIGNDSLSKKIIARERIPRQTPDGKWVRIYGASDGSADTETSEDGNFDAMENEWRNYVPAKQ